jgi:cobyrinic acid a,c-diamide synthase
MQPRSCPALFVSAPASNQGKTTVTAALARYHAAQGHNVCVFKTGADFLDPMILERASGRPVYQLDLWMGGEEHCRALLYEAAGAADLILIEGVMGLFDGTPSSADLAQLFGVPVLAVIDAEAMAQSFGAIAHGLATYRNELPFAGVLANRVAGARHAEMAEQGMPAGLAYWGAVTRDAGFELPDRHLGLVQAEEVGDLEQRLDALAAALRGTKLTGLPAPVEFAAPRWAPSCGTGAERAGGGGTWARESSGPVPLGVEVVPGLAGTPVSPGLPVSPGAAAPGAGPQGAGPQGAGPQGAGAPSTPGFAPPQVLDGTRIGVARDRAFSFLYHANLDVLRAMGAELVFFSPLADVGLPAVDSVYLPGGYPELHLARLAANRTMAAALREHVNAGKPLYAECGGMLYLLESLTDVKGQRADMVGILPGNAMMQPGLTGLGYQSAPLPGGVLRGHTFHHSRMETSLTPWARGERLYNTSPGEAIYRRGRLVASYLHTYFPSNPRAAAELFLRRD